jgi:hypothetical protein
MNSVEALGWLAAGLTLFAFSQRSMIPLRLTALGSNVSFIAYGVASGSLPILALHLVLLPCNLHRLGQLLSDRIRQRRHGATGLGVGPALWDLRCGAGWTPDALSNEVVAIQSHVRRLLHVLEDGPSRDAAQELAASMLRIQQWLPPCVGARQHAPDSGRVAVSAWQRVTVLHRDAVSASDEIQAAQRPADI